MMRIPKKKRPKTDSFTYSRCAALKEVTTAGARTTATGRRPKEELVEPSTITRPPAKPSAGLKAV